MADSAPETNYVKKPVYPEMGANPKTTRAPPAASRIAQAMPRPKPQSIAAVAGKAKKPPDPMEVARKIKAMAPMIASMGAR